MKLYYWVIIGALALVAILFFTIKTNVVKYSNAEWYKQGLNYYFQVKNGNRVRITKELFYKWKDIADISNTILEKIQSGELTTEGLAAWLEARK